MKFPWRLFFLLVLTLTLNLILILVASCCSGYHYCRTSFNKVWTQVQRRFKSWSLRIGFLRWCESLTMVQAVNKAKRLSSINHSAKQFITSLYGLEGDPIDQLKLSGFPWNLLRNVLVKNIFFLYDSRVV